MILWGRRNADALYYFTYVEGNNALFSTYSLFIIIPSIIGAACFPLVFRLTNNKAVVLYFYRLNKKAYNQIVEEIRERKEKR